MSHYISFQGKDYPLSITLSDRKSSVLIVHSDLTLEFRGRTGTSQKAVFDLVQKKLHLIGKKLAFFEQFHPRSPKHRYEPGETFHYLGRQYRLRIVPAQMSRVRLIGKWFVVEVKATDNTDSIRTAMDRWFRQKAIDRITERYLYYRNQLRGFITAFPDLRFRKMRSKWGSCSSRTITFNTELIKTPIACIDYIVVHELCHLLHPHHDKAFYHRLGRMLPDWKLRKNRLELADIS